MSGLRQHSGLSAVAQFDDWLVLLALLTAVTAAFSGDWRSAAAFALIAAINGYVAWRYSKHARSLAARLKSALLPRHDFPAERLLGTPLRRQLRAITGRLTIVAIVMELLLLNVGQAGGWDWQTGLAFGLAIMAALLPAGLLPELALAGHFAPASRAAAISAKITRLALSDNLAATLLLLVSLAGMLVWHVPLALNALQILALYVLLMAAPFIASAWDTRPPSPDSHRGAGKLLTFGITAALLAYANFLLFFARSALSPRFVDFHSPYLAKASSLALVTLLLCQLVNLFVVRADEHDRFLTDYLTSNRRLLQALALSGFILLNMLYSPPLQAYFRTGPLSLIDWLAAFAAAGIYLGLRLLQRHTRRHSRRAVLSVHLQARG